MPDWTNNVMDVTGKKEDVAAARSDLYVDGQFSFEGVLPKPEGLTPDEEYDWEIENWGVKWGPSNVQNVIDEDDHIQLEFDTPWGYPQKYVDALRQKHPNVEVDAGWMNQEWFSY